MDIKKEITSGKILEKIYESDLQKIKRKDYAFIDAVGLSPLSAGTIEIQPMEYTYTCDRCKKEIKCSAWQCDVLHLFDKKICKECTYKMFGLEDK